MTVQEVNAKLWRDMAKQYPDRVEALKGIVKGMNDAERFTFMRMCRDFRIREPLAFLERQRSNLKRWEDHYDLTHQPQKTMLAVYIEIFSEEKKSA